MLTRLYRVLDDRLNLKPVFSSLLDEKIPGGGSWVYVFGAAAAFIFLNRIATGIFMVLYDAPTPDHAYAGINSRGIEWSG